MNRNMKQALVYLGFQLGVPIVFGVTVRIIAAITGIAIDAESSSTCLGLTLSIGIPMGLIMGAIAAEGVER